MMNVSPLTRCCFDETLWLSFSGWTLPLISGAGGTESEREREREEMERGDGEREREREGGDRERGREKKEIERASEVGDSEREGERGRRRSEREGKRGRRWRESWRGMGRESERERERAWLKHRSIQLTTVTDVHHIIIAISRPIFPESSVLRHCQTDRRRAEITV